MAAEPPSRTTSAALIYREPAPRFHLFVCRCEHEPSSACCSSCGYAFAGHSSTTYYTLRWFWRPSKSEEHTTKTLKGDFGEVPLDTPRDNWPDGAYPSAPGE